NRTHSNSSSCREVRPSDQYVASHAADPMANDRIRQPIPCPLSTISGILNNMAQQYIFQMESLTKKIGQREVLKDIWLSFYPGAKIGVLGRNGSGKSTLLRIMAGIDKNFEGTAKLTSGFTVGILEQEPHLNPDKDVFGNVEEAVASTRALLTEFEQLSEKLGEVTDPDEMEKLLEREAKVQDQIDHVNAWELDRQVEIAMGAMNLPPGDAD